MKTIVYVLLDKFAEYEAAYLSSAVKMLAGDKFENKTLSLTKDSVTSIGGFNVVPDYDINSFPDDYEALVLIGGLTWRNEASLQIKPLVQRCIDDGRVLGAICDASAFLGRTGFLNNVKHTSNDIHDLKAWARDEYTGDDNYFPKQAVRDGKIITANGTAAMEFAREVMLALEVAPKERILEWFTFQKLGLYNGPMPRM